MAAEDPYYSRKRVPDEFIQDVGYTGLTPQQEYDNRERKYSVNGGDVRKHSNPKGLVGGKDPYYQRKQVPNSMIQGVGETGLTPEEEYLNRERKYSLNGADVRKFSHSTKGFLDPSDDPYYGRKQVHKTQTSDVGQIDMTPAQAYEVRERKQSLFQTSDDPFANLAGRNRGSVSGAAGEAAAAATSRRRSSAVAPDATAAATTSHHHSGYDGNRLEPIESRVEGAPPAAATHSSLGDTSTLGHSNGDDITAAAGSYPTTTTTTTTTTTNTANQATSGGTGHTTFYDAATVGTNHTNDPGTNITHHHQQTSSSGIGSTTNTNINTNSETLNSGNISNTTNNNNVRQDRYVDDPDSVAPDEVR